MDQDNPSVEREVRWEKVPKSCQKGGKRCPPMETRELSGRL
jgi:hypothetical protein